MNKGLYGIPKNRTYEAPLSASYALTASYALNGGGSGGDFVPSAWTGSSTSQFSGTASFTTSASFTSTASFVRTAQTASYILNAVSASFATTASYALNIDPSPVRFTGSSLYSITPVAGLPNLSAQSIFLGYQAGDTVKVNYSNFLGNSAGAFAATASYSNFLGLSAGAFSTNASNSNFLGVNAGANAINANNSNFLGDRAGDSAINASNSNFLGQSAGKYANSASYSTLLGYQVGATALPANSIGSNNIIIGTNITLPKTASNAINIGGILFGSGSYSTTSGNPFSSSVNGKIGINQPLPIFTLDVSGSGNYTDGLIVTSSFNISGSTTIKGATYNNESVNIDLGKHASNALVNIDSIDGSISMGSFNVSTINMLGNDTSILTGDGAFTTYNTNGGYFSIQSNGDIKIGNDSSKTINITGSARFLNPITSSLITYPGTTAIAPIVIASGSNLTTPISGAIEYDGTVLYSTNDASSQRGYIPSVNIFRLTANGSTITTIDNFFGANSAIQLAAGGEYEIEAYCYFAKTTSNGTVTVTISSSASPVNLSGIVQYGLLTNGANAGTANQIAVFNSALSSTVFNASGTLTTGVNHVFIIRLIVVSSNFASNLRINFTSNTGGLTPLRNSYYKVIKLPNDDVGNFVT